MSRYLAFALALTFAGCGRQTVELFDGAVSADGSAAVDTSDRDPERCGPAEVSCEDDEYCVAGACACRPRLTRIGDDCVDVQADAEHCGGERIVCALCVDGACGDTCPAGTTTCDGGCVDTSSHPLHCGECGRPCSNDQVCVDGLCRDFSPAPCAACPCGCATACCGYPGRAQDPICVVDDVCP